MHNEHPSNGAPFVEKRSYTFIAATRPRHTSIMPSTSGKKRPRAEEDALEIKAQNDKAVESMLERLDAIESCSNAAQLGGLVTDASCNLLEMKSLQRDMLTKLKEANSALQEKRAELKKQQVLLDSLEYEQSYLQGQTEAQLSTPHLERMCREEMQNEEMNKEESMNTFLCGSKTTSFEDPANYQTVLAKLHKEINLRGSLERDAIQAQKSLAEKTKALEQNQQFLKELPKKLNQMEKASLPLQKFFGKDVTMIGTERSKRLEMARSLPGPLYTLFVQLQSYLDASPEEGVSIHVTKKIVKPTSSETEDWFQPDSHAVQLQMTLPDAKNKQVIIEFVHLPRLNVVTAEASGGADKVDLHSLLMNLFPCDEGNMVWSAESVHLKDAASSFLPGRPYHWCNYLAGIHLPPTMASGSLDPLSTRAVVKELLSRLDANTTLTNILTTLKNKKTIPVHSAWSDASDSSSPIVAKLSGWTEEGNEGYVKTFAATLKRKSTKVKATVTVDMSRYPSVPPRWSLTTGGESWGEQHGSMEALESGTNPLYDNDLGRIEHKVNGQLEELVNRNDKETYNWVLGHQLHRLVRMWDESERASENGEGAGQVPRSIKGKDRSADS